MQNGVLKSLSFLFEYIGEMGKDYIYAVTPLLEDALMDRDLVHRQTAASVVQHMSLGVAGAQRCPPTPRSSPPVCVSLAAVVSHVPGSRCASSYAPAELQLPPHLRMNELRVLRAVCALTCLAMHRSADSSADGWLCCCAGLGCEDALMHLLNLVWPNIFEISPHVVQAVTGAINGCRLALGPAVILSYLLQGLWHPARYDWFQLCIVVLMVGWSL